MAQPTEHQGDESLGTLATELRDLVVGYAKQETLDPLKSLARFIGWGLGGAVCMAIGLVLLALAALRVLQQEAAPHLSGNWSWVPYLVVIVVSAGVIALLVRAILAARREAQAARVRLSAGARAEAKAQATAATAAAMAEGKG